MFESCERKLFSVLEESFENMQRLIDVIDKLLKTLETNYDVSVTLSEVSDGNNVGWSSDGMISQLKELKVKLSEKFDRDSCFLQRYSAIMHPEPSGHITDLTAQMCLSNEPTLQNIEDCIALVSEMVNECELVNSDILYAVETEHLRDLLNEYNHSSMLLSEAYQNFSDELCSAAAAYCNSENSAEDSSGRNEEVNYETETRDKNKSTVKEGLDWFLEIVDSDEHADLAGTHIRKSMAGEQLYPTRLKKRLCSNAELVPPPTIDSVRFSALSPETVSAGKYLHINIVMYEDEYRSAVDEIISACDEPTKESKSGYHDVERNSVIKVVLSSADVHIEDDTEEEIWNGKYLNFEFAVKIPSDIAEEQILMKASVYINDIPATKLKLIVECNKNPGQNITVSRKDISSAFVSYASEDRHRVAAIVQGMEKARPDMKIFFDVASIRSGQYWEDVLTKEMDNSDVLFLCWSPYAKASDWVDYEWRYTLESKGEEAIEPVPIVTPDKCPPPPELKHKHFNDRCVYIIEATKPQD